MMARTNFLAMFLATTLAQGADGAISSPNCIEPSLQALGLAPSACSEEAGVRRVEYRNRPNLSSDITAFDQRHLVLVSATSADSFRAATGAGTKEKHTRKIRSVLVQAPLPEQISHRAHRRTVGRHRGWRLFTEHVHYLKQGGGPGFVIQCTTAVKRSRGHSTALAECFPFEAIGQYLQTLDAVDAAKSIDPDDRRATFMPDASTWTSVEVTQGSLTHSTTSGELATAQITTPLDPDGKPHLAVEDYNFDGHLDFSVWHSDAGMGATSIHRVFLFDPPNRNFVEAASPCDDEFVNLKVNTRKRVLVSTVFRAGRPKICTFSLQRSACPSKVGCRSTRSTTLGTTRTISAASRTLLRRVRVDFLKEMEDPRESRIALRWLKGPFKVIGHAGNRWTGVVQIKSRDRTNTYCRLVAADLQDDGPPVLVDVPESANSDRCLGVHSFLHADLNGDGVRDWLLSVRVPSNRHGVDVVDSMVYIAQPDLRQPYCYSGNASDAVAALPPTSIHAVRSSIQRVLDAERSPPNSCQAP